MTRTVRLLVDVEIRPATVRDLPALATWSGHVEGYARTGETLGKWPEPMPDGTVQQVDHPSWVMRKEL